MATDTRKPLADLIRDLGITADVRPDHTYAPKPDDSWSRDAHHYKVTLSRGRTRIVVPFHQGSAHTAPPTVTDVIDCLISDATGFENVQSFEDWCAEYGYDTDSRTAERTYKAVERQTGQLRRLLGEEYEQIWDVESL
jgi:hypothetical protein